MRFLSLILSYVLKGLIKLYKYLISPLLGPKCRYLPTCSEYAYEAIDRFGPFKGTVLAVWRILRCNPWGGHGFDPVPPLEQENSRNKKHMC
ncbi:membrane protein insertion efficiency factor YidD [Luteithermobacter gelatinilyticus]|uniref:membrane protein insertion efficiency factor YidD n=1 Tax=Luteithermobacter gelatinilyticus TaxID=2582913 RepID=UPI001AEFD534|nr:membrane protein insertion efficiency factor YidD [Luteithermobacter gelatinilyticus]|tara:strand:+ start:20276 stop:20548 length:273 start_codon:yes stop_codon:yes gene_type:complete